MLTGAELGRALREAIAAKGVTQKAVAAHFGVKPPSVSDWLNRGTIDKSKLPELWGYFADAVGPEHWGLARYPMDMSPNDAAPAGKGAGSLAHDLSQAPRNIDPITMEWESILKQPLPEKFRLQVRDDAMSTTDGGLRPGHWAIFSTVRRPAARDAVLLRDKTGYVCIRQYVEVRPGHWAASARQPGYMQMDSLEDGLEVLAVLVGHEW